MNHECGASLGSMVWQCFLLLVARTDLSGLILPVRHPGNLKRRSLPHRRYAPVLPRPKRVRAVRCADVGVVGPGVRPVGRHAGASPFRRRSRRILRSENRATAPRSCKQRKARTHACADAPHCVMRLHRELKRCPVRPRPRSRPAEHCLSPVEHRAHRLMVVGGVMRDRLHRCTEL